MCFSTRVLTNRAVVHVAFKTVFGSPRGHRGGARSTGQGCWIVQCTDKGRVQYVQPRLRLSMLLMIADGMLAGKSGCGKSYLLLQAVQYAIQKDWVTLYIPRGQ